MIKEFAFVAYPVTDMKRARAFYEQVLDLKPDAGFENSDTWVEYTIGNNTLSLGSMDGWVPSKDGGNIAFEVEDFDATIAKLKEKDVKFAMEAQSFPNCKMALIHDSEGNAVLIHKRNESSE